MRRPVLAWSALAVACYLGMAGSAFAQTNGGMCEPSTTNTEKWKPRAENGGMILLLPPGFGAGGNGSGLEVSGAHFYQNGEHRQVVVGFGPGLQSMMSFTNVSEKGECETTIAGRHVSIIVYNWVVEDAVRSASGNAGAHFAAVARFYPVGAQREVYIALISNVMSELKYFKPIFFAVTFDGGSGAAAAAGAPAAVSTVSDMHPVAVVAASAPPQSCAIADQPAGAPSMSTVVDSAAVQAQLAGKPEIPNGYELMTVQYGATGAFSGVKVAQTNFDDATQRELAAALGPNVKTHDAAAPASLMLRVDASMRGLHYTALPAGSCTP